MLLKSLRNKINHDERVKPIRSELDYQAMLHEIENLMSAQPGTPEGDRLDVLITLVEAYEAKHFPIPEPDDPVAVLEYYIESRGVNRKDLIPFLGSKERVSEILNRKRGLSLDMIRRLHIGLGIPTDLLVGTLIINNTSNSNPIISSVSP